MSARRTKWIERAAIAFVLLAWVPIAGARPAKPVKAAVRTPAGDVRVEMPREHVGEGDAIIVVHAPPQGIERIVLHYVEAGRQITAELRPAPEGTSEPVTGVKNGARSAETGMRIWTGTIAHHDPGTQIPYYLRIEPRGAQAVAVPASAPEKPVRMTFKGRPSPPVLIAHIVAMMGGLIPLMIAFVAAWTYLVRNRGLVLLRRSALIGFVSLLLGGVPLGMIVESQVFGTSWQGWPFGRDVTDTKTAVLLLAWLALLLSRGRALFGREAAVRGPRDRAWAAWVIVLGIVTAGVYLIPHENVKF